MLRNGVTQNIGITSKRAKNIAEIHKPQYVENPKQSSMEAFLNSYPKKNTRRLYKRGIDKFADWYGKSIDEILAERKDDLTPKRNESLIDAKQRANHYEKLLEEFYNWLETEGYNKANTRYAFCKGLIRLFGYYEMHLTLRNNSPVNQTNAKTDDFPLKPDHVKKMFHVAKDLRSKLLVCIGNDLGWRINDVLCITKNELPNLDQEAPIEWMRITQKENQVSKTCLSKTTVLLLKEYMFTFPSGENPYLFFNNGGTIDDYVVNRRLKDLAEDAKIPLGNLSLSWHCFRKMIISTAKNLSIDPDIIKIMVGKAVEKSMLPYLNGIDVKTAFIKLQTVTGITTLTESSEDGSKAMTKEIEKLNSALSHVESENSISKTRIDLLQKTAEEQQKQIVNLTWETNFTHKEIKRANDIEQFYIEELAKLNHMTTEEYMDKLSKKNAKIFDDAHKQALEESKKANYEGESHEQ